LFAVNAVKPARFPPTSHSAVVELWARCIVYLSVGRVGNVVGEQADKELTMVPRRRRTAALVDLANLSLGIVLFLGPWIFGFVSDVASENAWVSGALVSLVATAAIVASDAREERINLILGLWVAGSPWLLRFHAEMHIHFIVGVMVAALALVEMWLSRNAVEAQDTAASLRRSTR